MPGVSVGFRSKPLNGPQQTSHTHVATLNEEPQKLVHMNPHQISDVHRCPWVPVEGHMNPHQISGVQRVFLGSIWATFCRPFGRRFDPTPRWRHRSHREHRRGCPAVLRQDVRLTEGELRLGMRNGPREKRVTSHWFPRGRTGFIFIKVTYLAGAIGRE